MVVAAALAVHITKESLSCEFDSKAWKRANSQRHWFDDGAEGDRRRLANRLIRCRSLAGVSKRRVISLLGSPGGAGGYPLGPDWLGIDQDVFYVGFGRSGRVESVYIGGN